MSFQEYFDEVLGFIKEANDTTDIITAMRLWNLDSYSIKGDNSLNADIVDKIKEVFDYKEDLKTILNNDKRTKLKENLYLNVADKFQWPNMNIEPLGDTGFCHGLRDHFGILVDGTVVPCCLDGEGNMSLGNIYKESLMKY